MKCRVRLVSLIVFVAILAAGNLLACGDKFLVGSRGTRYQRPKNARAASVVIYTSSPADVARLESVLTRHGHRASVVTTIDQLSAAVAKGGLDVVLAASGMADGIRQIVAGAANAAVVVALDRRPNAAAVLSAIDSAVEQHDHRSPRN